MRHFKGNVVKTVIGIDMALHVYKDDVRQIICKVAMAPVLAAVAVVTFRGTILPHVVHNSRVDV